MSLFHRGSASGPAEGSSKPPRRKDRIRGLFSHSRSPSPSPSRSQAKNARAFPTNNQPLLVSPPQGHASPTLPGVNLTPNSSAQLACQKGPGASKSRPQATRTELPPDVKTDAVDLPESAYQRALASFGEDEREKLTKQDTIRGLFQQLNESDHGHQERSLLRKGLKRVKPYLERLNATIDFISPFTSMEPAAGTALGLVKGASSIAIAICGRFEDMTDNIAGFLERIPAIDRCSAVVRGDGRLQDIYNALVDVFKDLLQFYLETVALFEGSRFVLSVALDILKPSIADIVSSFNTHVDLLSRLLETETFAAVQELKDGQVEALILETLDNHWNYESDHDDELRKRADDACSWLTSDDAFSYWLLNRDSNVLVLFGDMGSGKTMTTAFVADSLAHPARPLCAYYCKDEHEPAKLRNIYRSILFQFLQQSHKIKLRFWKWYKETSPMVRGNPTQSDDKLRELLYDIVSSSKKPVFLVLDALDECKAQSRKQLFSLFQELFENKAPLKVFLSSRYDENVEADLPPGVTRIDLRSSHDRDRAIAAYLVTGTNLPAALHPKVVEELAARSRGSAIWLRIAVEYIEGSQSASPKGLEMALARLPSSEGLAELYGKLFGKICGRIQENKALLQRALEILAVARRPLTLEELTCAVFTINSVSDDEEEDAATLAELDKLTHSVNLFNFVRPFITAAKGKDGKNPRLRLVHQSLKELVLTAPPSEWCSAEAMAKRKKGERVAELDADLLQRCVRYLLFDENDERSLFPNSDDEARDAELFAIGDVFDNEVGVQVPTGAGTPSSRRSSAFSSSEPGFGGFFAYAAAYWTSHFSDVSPPERRPSAQQLIALCGKGSQRLENWVEQWRRPSCPHLPERSFPEPLSRLDPLVIAAIFGPAASVTDILMCGLGSSILAKDSAWTAVTHLIERGDISLIKSLIVQDTVLQPTLCCCKFLYTAISAWRWESDEATAAAAAAATRNWEEIFEFLISRLRGDLIDCGNDILRRAAGRGCLVLIKKLFDAGARDAELRQAMLTQDDDDDAEENPRCGGGSISSSRSFFNRHQSIGEAAFWGHADVVRFLCEQPGLESHLRYTNRRSGDTVFHQAARRPSEEVLRTLIRHWPEGVNVANKSGDTPLIVLVFSNPSGCEAETARLVRLLLREGKADADPGGSYSAFCIAVRGGYTTVARLLVVEGGADVLQAVGIDEVTGRPFLRRGMVSWVDEKGQEQMLRELCSLLPLAVSVEYFL